MSGVSASPPPTFFSLEGRPKTRGGGLQRDRVVQCNSSTNPPPPGSGVGSSVDMVNSGLVSATPIVVIESVTLYFRKMDALVGMLNMRNAIGKGLQSAVDALSDFNSNKMYLLSCFFVLGGVASVVVPSGNELEPEFEPSRYPNGDSDSRSILDAFFLGKALAEALNERIESTVGEFLSVVGRLQAEQQKQDEVLERAKRAKEKAAREALEAQGLIPKSTTAATDSVTSTASTTSAETPANSPLLSNPNSPCPLTRTLFRRAK
ncbi:Uncharacterized protein, chloroplastic [Vitis vinifera]|uniref:Uncharacterized protein, chloroplastic n=1 Tax=Vitis vinifera TaxID=29760 RepID=A0A438GG22_VITVI|nr:Uncharacterized protein, chloroplastic [Vitis vinifera]